MSGALKFGNLKLPRLVAASILSGAGNAGPRRLAMLTVSVLVIGGLVVAIATGGRRAPPVSQDARMGAVDPLPGGLHSTPEQDALSHTAEEAHAKAALGQGVSYTPQMAPSVPVRGPIPHAEGPAPEQADPQRPRFVVRPTSTPVQRPVVLPVAFPEPAGAAQPAVQTVQATVVDPKAEAAYSKQIGDLFSQWGGRLPQTDIVLPATGPEATGDGAPGTTNVRGAAARRTQHVNGNSRRVTRRGRRNDPHPGWTRRLRASGPGGELGCQQPGRHAGGTRDRSPATG